MKKEYKLQNGQTVVFKYDENRIGKITVEAMDCLIDMLPKWIPCDERLPEINHNVLISTVYGQVKEADFIGFDVESQPKWVSHGCLYWAEEVLRWMPLPEPYKGENDG